VAGVGGVARGHGDAAPLAGRVVVDRDAAWLYVSWRIAGGVRGFDRDASGRLEATELAAAIAFAEARVRRSVSVRRAGRELGLLLPAAPPAVVASGPDLEVRLVGRASLGGGPLATLELRADTGAPEHRPRLRVAAGENAHIAWGAGERALGRGERALVVVWRGATATPAISPRRPH
jgi:hypothetical protein